MARKILRGPALTGSGDGGRHGPVALPYWLRLLGKLGLAVRAQRLFDIEVTAERGARWSSLRAGVEPCPTRGLFCPQPPNPAAQRRPFAYTGALQIPEAGSGVYGFQYEGHRSRPPRVRRLAGGCPRGAAPPAASRAAGGGGAGGVLAISLAIRADG